MAYPPANSGGMKKEFGSAVFYEYTVRDDADLRRVVDDVHFNPVKHGLAANVKDWPFSSFHRFVCDALLPPDWGGTAGARIMNFGE